MNKILKVMLVLLAATLLLAGGVVGYLYLNQSVLSNYFVQKLNEQLEARVSIEKIDLELLHTFPRVGLDLNEVKISDPLRKEQFLLEARHIFIGFNLYDILSKNYEIKQIVVDSGTVHIFRSKDGVFNFNILKKGPATGENIFLKLRSVKFNRTSLSYLDIPDKQDYDLHLEQIGMSGSFSGVPDNITCKGSLHVDHFKVGSVNLIRKKNTNVDFMVSIDALKQVFSIKKGLLEIGDLKLDATGNLKNNPGRMFADIQFSARELSVQSLISLLPVKLNAINEYKSSGNIYFRGLIKGPLTRQEHPLVEIEFGISDGKLTRPATQLSIDNIACKGHFSNGLKRNTTTSVLELKGLHLRTKNGLLKGEVAVRNFVQPYLDAEVQGNLEAGELVKLLNNPNITGAEGSVQFNGSLHGTVKDFSSKEYWNKTRASGTFDIALQHIRLAAQKEIASLNASLSLQQNDVLINSFKCNMQQSDITISGKLLHVVPWLLSNRQVLEADIAYTSDYIDLEHVMIPLGESSAKNAKAPPSPMQLPDNVLLKARVEVGKLVYRKFSAQQVKALIDWKGKKLTVDGLNCQAMNGTLSGIGQVENAADGRFLITSTLVLKEININQLFQQCANFGQDELTDKHLHGTLNASIDMASVWSSTLTCDLDKLYAFGEVQITNGEIIGYKPLETLSKYIDITDLRHLRFAELKNKIEIKNRTIFIPGMDVHSNALNLTLAGTHTFSNYLDYKMKIRLSELLTKKRKPHESEFEEEEPSGKGLHLFLSMKGPINQLKFSYDKAGVKKKITQDIVTEKESIKSILKKELGIGRDTTIKEKQNDSEELEFEKE